MLRNTIFLVILVVFGVQGDATTPTPIVLWHGMGDSCCFPFSLGKFKSMLEAEIPGVYVKSLKIGGNVFEDYESGYFMHPNRQILDVCNQIKKDDRLSDGFNAIGFSQGGQFLRGLVQRCEEAKVHNLITLGGQHQGVFGVPNCNSLSHKSCESLRRALTRSAYTQALQNHLVQATYWHDPMKETDYRQHSSFLANINNEYDLNIEYSKNLQKLNKFVMVKFTNDTMVTPRDSSWFSFYASGQDSEILPLKESRVYSRLGLNKMMLNNQLAFLESAGNHLQFSHQWFVDNILIYLR